MGIRCDAVYHRSISLGSKWFFNEVLGDHISGLANHKSTGNGDHMVLVNCKTQRVIVIYSSSFDGNLNLFEIKRCELWYYETLSLFFIITRKIKTNSECRIVGHGVSWSKIAIDRPRQSCMRHNKNDAKTQESH